MRNSLLLCRETSFRDLSRPFQLGNSAYLKALGRLAMYAEEGGKGFSNFGTEHRDFLMHFAKMTTWNMPLLFYSSNPIPMPNVSGWLISELSRSPCDGHWLSISHLPCYSQYILSMD